MTWSENAQVGEYRLREQQFRGTSSTSWLAQRVATGETVRLARLEVPASLEEMREPILNAVRQAIQRGEPLRDVGVVPGTLQVRDGEARLVTPCPEGPTLRERLKAGWPGGLEQQLAVATSLANVVACAHEHQLAHGFLAPENLFLTPEGRAQVVEFGIHAPEIGSLWPAPAEGSPYWPQEARLAAHPARRDLYALGVLLYEIFTGAAPPAETGPGAAERLAGALPERLPRSLPARIAAAILQEESGEPVTARQLAVQLAFACSWVRAVARGEREPEETAQPEADEEQGLAPSRDGAMPAAAAAPPVVPEVRPAPTPSPFAGAVPPAPMIAVPAGPAAPPAVPPRWERLPIWAWWAGVSSGMLATLGLVAGIYIGTHWAGGAGRRPAAAVAGSFDMLPQGRGGATVYDFEDGTAMGWRSRQAALFVQETHDVARRGLRALKVRLYRAAMANPAEISVLPPPSLAPASRVRLQVLVPYGSMPGLNAKAFVQDAAWQWTDGGATRLTPGVWTELTIAVPPNALMPLKALGIHFEAGTPWSGRLYVDDVREVPTE